MRGKFRKVRNSSKGSLFIVSAPSGAGKTTLCKELCSKIPNLKHSVSYTTRKPRQGEVNGRDYTFVDEAEFQRMIDRGEFAEWAVVHGNFYGTSRKRLDEMLQRGIDVILDIDVQGAKKIKEVYGDAVCIFIMPPSMDVLKERLKNRKTDPDEVIKSRLDHAIEEIREYKWYNYVIVNNVFEEALRELEAVVTARRLCVDKIDPLWVEKNFLIQGDG